MMNISILKYLPHRPPMQMVDTITHINDTSIVTEFLIPEDCIFLEKDCRAVFLWFGRGYQEGYWLYQCYQKGRNFLFAQGITYHTYRGYFAFSL